MQSVVNLVMIVGSKNDFIKFTNYIYIEIKNNHNYQKADIIVYSLC